MPIRQARQSWQIGEELPSRPIAINRSSYGLPRGFTQNLPFKLPFDPDESIHVPPRTRIEKQAATDEPINTESRAQQRFALHPSLVQICAVLYSSTAILATTKDSKACLYPQPRHLGTT